jgi:hypothetical protein
MELMPETIRQPALWGELDRGKGERAWSAMDKLNATLGRDTSGRGGLFLEYEIQAGMKFKDGSPARDQGVGWRWDPGLLPWASICRAFSA